MPRDFLPEKKKHGIYYTPPEASKILCEWAIQSRTDVILEPSFGACGFLESSRDRLAELGSPYPSLQLFGCDIDPKAFNGYLHSKFSDPTILNRFIEGDFLEKTLSDFPAFGFDVVIGNPPYVSYHNMSSEQRISCGELIKNSGYSIGNRSSLWAYFVQHGLSFLKKGGRIAWVLPSSFLHAKYADAIKKNISDNFAHSIIIQVGQRLFASEGTEESTAILLADGWKKGRKKQNLKIEFATTLSELKKIISAWKDKSDTSKKYADRSSYSLLSSEVNKVLQILDKEKNVTQLGDILEILIGIVTGNNRFFVIDQAKVDENNLTDDCLSPIFSRFNMAKGLLFSPSDLQEFREQNFRCLLVDTSKVKKINASLKKYLDSYPESDKEKNVTFKKRGVWHQPNDQRMPAAFFSYMHHQGPRLVINDAGVTCTNTIHRVFPKKKGKETGNLSSTELKLLAISLQTTYSQLSAELEGRVYGSGALKHEPSEVKKIKVLKNNKLTELQIERAYKVMDFLFRKSRFDDARKFADKLLLGSLDRRFGHHILPVLDATLKEVRSRRYDRIKRDTEINPDSLNGK